MTNPLNKPSLPSKFTWRALPSSLNTWLYEIKCKVCSWAKLSDYDNVIEWAQFHQCERRRR